jgi:hypothetical protein
VGKNKKAKRAAKAASSEYDLIDALGAAGWAEADESLAEALAGFSELELSAKILAADAGGLRRRADRIEAQLVLLRQSLGQLARARGLSRFGEVGALEPYDPARHQLRAAAKKTPAQVRVLASGVARGAAQQILVKAAAEAAPKSAGDAPAKTSAKASTRARSGK